MILLKEVHCGLAFKAVVFSNLDLQAYSSYIMEKNNKLREKQEKYESETVKRSIFDGELLEKQLSNSIDEMTIKKIDEAYSAYEAAKLNAFQSSAGVKTRAQVEEESEEGSKSFYQSEAYTAVKSEIEVEKARIGVRNHTIWLHKKQEHDELKLKQAESVHILASVKQQQLELVSIGHFVRAFEGGKGLIIQKVTDALKEFPGIKAKLRVTVDISEGGTNVDPLQQQNLHGIIKTLFKEYNKPTLLRFTKALLDLVSYEVSETVAITKPIEVLDNMLGKMKQWKQLCLNEYMDDDKLFTVMTLKAFPPNSEIRKEGVRHMTSYVSRKNALADLETDSSVEMPIFSELQDWINNFSKSNEFSSSIMAGLKSKNGQQLAPNRDRLPNFTPSKGTERAHATSESTGQNYGSMLDTKLLTGFMTKPVPRSSKLHVLDAESGKKVLYTATTEKCPLCSDTKVQRNATLRLFAASVESAVPAVYMGIKVQSVARRCQKFQQTQLRLWKLTDGYVPPRAGHQSMLWRRRLITAKQIPGSQLILKSSSVKISKK